MPTVDLEMQLKFLGELEDALGDALVRYSEDKAEKRAELKYMKNEVLRAQRMIRDKMCRDDHNGKKAAPSVMMPMDYSHAAFS